MIGQNPSSGTIFTIQVKLDKPKVAGRDNLFGLSRFSFYQILQ